MSEPTPDTHPEWFTKVERAAWAERPREADPLAFCPGAGRPWGSGTGTPICPVCHAGPRSLAVRPPVRRLGRWTGVVPVHAPRRP